mgnify:CR=1 FL=1
MLFRSGNELESILLNRFVEIFSVVSPAHQELCVLIFTYKHLADGEFSFSSFLLQCRGIKNSFYIFKISIPSPEMALGQMTLFCCYCRLVFAFFVFFFALCEVAQTSPWKINLLLQLKT